jgi:hypothetical protein
MSDPVRSLTLTKSEIMHLLHLLGNNDMHGDYYGSPAHYWKRHASIVKKLRNANEKQKH